MLIQELIDSWSDFLTYLLPLYSSASILIGYTIRKSPTNKLNWSNVALLISYITTSISVLIFTTSLFDPNTKPNQLFIINETLLIASISITLMDALRVGYHNGKPGIRLLFLAIAITISGLVAIPLAVKELNFIGIVLSYATLLIILIILIKIINFLIKAINILISLVALQK